MVLVTGGTGLIGSHLLLYLLNSEVALRAIHRKGSDLEKVKTIFSYYSAKPDDLFRRIEWVEADINDIPSLEDAFHGVTQVYHCAALISFDPSDFEKLRKINEEGTANIVNLCNVNKVAKLCYVSSIAAIGKSVKGTVTTEETEWDYTDANVYALTKYAAEMEVWRASQEGLSTVIVNPGVVIGPGFWNSGSGRLFKMAAKELQFYPPGGSGFITVNDVVKIMVQLMDSEVVNERFIAVHKNLNYQEILSDIARGFGKTAPVHKLKFWQLEILWRIDWLWCLLTGKKRKLTKVGVLSLKNPQEFSNIKVVNRLDFEFESMAEVIHFSCNRFKEEYPNQFS